MRILLIEDDLELCKALTECLDLEGIIVDSCQEGDTGSYIARTNHYDVIILDNVLPKKMGIEICRELRRSHIKTPILFMSIHGSTDERVAYLEAGADDCITKPFAVTELVAKIRALTRRPYTIQEDIITIDDVTIDSQNHTVHKKGKSVYMTRKEFLILEHMARKPGKIISRTDIMDRVWNKDFDPFSNTIETHIRNIRRKIENKKIKKIETIPGRGYRLATKETGSIRKLIRKAKTITKRKTTTSSSSTL